MRRIALFFIFVFCFTSGSNAAPCYGTRMPEKKEFFSGVETYSIFKRYLENAQGKLRSTQHFLLISYGVYDWLSIDLKGGAGNIKQRPTDRCEIDYTSNFAGGYGLRLKAYDKEDLKLVLGFQHISVHPKSRDLGDIRHKAILDDWQFSLLASWRDIFGITPYLGTRWSRLDYIHWTGGDRKRMMSDLTKGMGLILGLDIPLLENSWFNLEGQWLDSEAVAGSINFKF